MAAIDIFISDPLAVGVWALVFDQAAAIRSAGILTSGNRLDLQDALDVQRQEEFDVAIHWEGTAVEFAVRGGGKIGRRDLRREACRTRGDPQLWRCRAG